MKVRFLFFSIFIFSKIFALEVNVYAASDLIFVFEEIQKEYEKNYPNDKIKIIFGSSGKGYNQILNGAPYDLIFSANMEYIYKLKEKGFLISEIKTYGIGRIVLWKKKENKINLNKGIFILLERDIQKIAIANWEHAPYGLAAKECLEFYGIYNKLKNKLVLGENISKTASFVISGAADIGILALSLAISKNYKEYGEYILLPNECHKQIEQGYGILKNVLEDQKKYETAKRFYNFISSAKAKDIFIKFGFLVPVIQ